VLPKPKKKAAGAVIDNGSELTTALAEKVRELSGVLRLAKAEQAKGLHTKEDDACMKYYTWKMDKGWLLHVLLRRDRYAEARKALREAAGDGLGDASYLLVGWIGRRNVMTGKFVTGPRDDWKPNLKFVKASIQMLHRTGRLSRPSNMGVGRGVG
jgi:hypothetical protein